MKICSKCQISKPKTEFYPRARSSDGLGSQCKECHCAGTNESRRKLVEKRKENPVTIPATKICPTCAILKSSDDFYKDISDHLGLYHECKSCFRDNKRKEKYNLTPEEWKKMYEDQQGRCAWCGGEEVDGVFKSRLVIDHCHDTGVVRRLLCDGCNTAEGLLKHVPHIIASIEAVAWFPLKK